MNAPLINPHLLEAGYARVNVVRAPGGKVYLAKFGSRQICQYARRKPFRTARGALAYSRKLLERWRKLYDVALEIHASSVARSEESGESSRVPAPIEQESSHERQAETVAELCEGSTRPLC